MGFLKLFGSKPKWKDKLREIVQEQKTYGEKVNIGASEGELKRFFEEAKCKRRVELPADYAEILKTVNGLEFNGYILYGIDERLLDKTPDQSINGLIARNEVWYENDRQKRYVFIGESDISWYVYDLEERRYSELDNPSGEECEVFSSLECMVEKMLNDALL